MVTFQELRRFVEAKDVEVSGGLLALHGGAAGEYHPPQHHHRTGRLMKARIGVYPPEGDGRFREPEDTITLAHEYGHHLSFMNGTRAAAYEEAVKLFPMRVGELTDAQRRLILEEEERAWALGREALKAIGDLDTTMFEAQQVDGLGFYRAKLASQRDPMDANDRSRTEH